MIERDRRIGENEALFRNINEQVLARSDGLAVGPKSFVSFVCECGLMRCTEKIDLHPREYEEIRADPLHFAIRPGHEALATEGVVSRNSRYW